MNPPPEPPSPKSRQNDHHHATPTTKAPPELPGGAYLSPSHVVTDHDVTVVTRRGRQQLAKCGVQVVMSDLFGVAGSRLLDELALPGVFPARVASYRRLIEALEFEIDLYTRLLGGRLAADPGS